MRYYVAPNGTATGGNSWANPGILTNILSNVITAPSRGGDEIWVLQGTYNLAGNPLVINNNTEPLSIYGGFAGWENTLCDRNANIDSLQYPTFFQNPSILDGGGANRVIEMQGANICRIDGFIIQNGNATMQTIGFDGGGMRVFGRNIWLENLVIMDNVAGNNGGGIYTTGIWGLMIKNTIFFNNRANNNGGGIWIGDGGNKLLVNLLFNANQTLVATGNGNAISIFGDLGMKIINNTISGNIGGTGSSSVYCMPSPGGQGVDIYNSIIYPDALAAGGGTPFANVTVDYCLLSNPIPFANPANPNGINPPPPPAPPVDPLFVNPAGRNFHLMNTAAIQSPCIDSGNTNFIFPLSATDLEGKPRFINNTAGATTIQVDMGAFEVQ